MYKRKKFGAVFCSCGGSIEEKISFDELKDLISPHVDWIEKFEILCSEESTEHFKELIRQKKPDGLIILACSPENKGSVLGDLAKKAGLNPYMLNIVNLREQVAWVTESSKDSVKKAYALFIGALNRLKKQYPLDEIKIPISKNIVIVGGGVAGITAALTLSKGKKRVYLVEREHSLGGRVTEYEKLFPELSCGRCFVHPMVEEVLNSRIELRLNSEIKEIKGYPGNVFVKILIKPLFVDPKKCIGCFVCTEACPEKAIEIEPLRLPAIAKINSERCLIFKGKNCEECINVCPVKGAISFKKRQSEEKVHASAVLWATGFDIFDCRKIPALGYGRYTDIYNAVDFELIVNTEGPSKGEILTEKGKTPKSVAIIHCVGSLDEKYLPYCSRICCEYAFKFNRILREKIPGVKIIHFIKEIVLSGKASWELYYRVLKDPKVKIIRYKNISELEVREENSLFVMRGKRKYRADVVVLCPAILCKDTSYGEERGVYLTGSVKEAMSIAESIGDALSICGKILSEFGGDNLVRAPTVAKIDYNKCKRCGICIPLCPYGAIELEGVEVKLNQTLCEGCGICVSACPSRALNLEGFTSEQIISEIEGILSVLREG